MTNRQHIEKQIAIYLEPIKLILEDADVTEIMVTADGQVWVERFGSIENSGLSLSESARKLALINVAKAVGRDLIKDTTQAIVSTSVGGLRFAGALMPIDERGTTLCIRKHQDPERRPSLEQLVEWGMLTQIQADLLVKLIIKDKQNAVFIGPTSGGKTTLANAILGKIPSYERIGSIEDAYELAIKVPNRDSYLTNPQTGITARVLIQHAMRSRYDRLVLGESRGDDTFDLIRALSSGHNGSITTIHGSSARQGLGALEMLFQMSLPEGSSIPVETSRGYIAKCINVLIYTERQYLELEGGGFKSVRSVKEIVLVKGVENGEYKTETI